MSLLLIALAECRKIGMVFYQLLVLSHLQKLYFLNSETHKAFSDFKVLRLSMQNRKKLSRTYFLCQHCGGCKCVIYRMSGRVGSLTCRGRQPHLSEKMIKPWQPVWKQTGAANIFKTRITRSKRSIDAKRDIWNSFKILK